VVCSIICTKRCTRMRGGIRSKITHFLSFSLVGLLLLSIPLRINVAASGLNRAAEVSDSGSPEAASVDALAYRV
jgi:hypothetical protein